MTGGPGPGPGHNGGPAFDAGVAWRAHCWRAARTALLPTLPVEVVRLRVARARELGLPYRTYAGIRAASGQDVIAGALRAATGRMPSGACLLIGVGALEAEWAVPGRLAGFLPAEAYFA